MKFHILIAVFAFALNAVFGMIVYFSNPRRAVNRQFFFASCTIGGYLFSLGSTFVFVGDTEKSTLFLRLTCCFAIMVLLSMHLLRQAIWNPRDGFWELLFKSKLWLANCLVGCGLSFSPFFIKSMGVGFIPQPEPGPGIMLFNLQIAISVVIAMAQYIWDLRKAKGIRRTEVQYVLVGITAFLVFSVTCGVLGPSIVGFQDWSTIVYLPISMVVLDVILAYGIAANRILDISEFLRKGIAYGLSIIYMGIVYVVILGCGDVLKGVIPGFPDWVSPLIAGFTMAFSFAPAGGVMQKFANRLFINATPVDVPTTLRHANRLVQSLKPVDELLEEFCGLISRVVGTEDVRILLLGAGHMFEQVYPSEGAKGGRLDMHSDLAEILGQHDFALAIDTLQRMRPTGGIIASIQQLHELSGKVIVGVRYHGVLQGVILLGDRLSGRIYSRTDQEALQLLSNQLGVAIENAKLYSEVNAGKVYNETLLERLVSGIIAIDSEGQVRTFNQEAQRITGTYSASIIGSHYSLLPDVIADCLRKSLVDGGEIRDKEVQLDTPDAENLRVSTSIFHNADTRKRSVLMVCHDMTTLVKLERQVRKNDRLASIGTVAAGMAHEIKNPLVAIKTFAQLLPDRYDDTEFRATFAELIESEATRIDDIVTRLLHFAKPPAPILVEVSIHELLNSMVSFLTHQFRKRGVSIGTDFNADDERLWADPNLLEQVVLNLMLNALDSMDSDGVLTIRTRVVEPLSGPGTLCMEFEDTGCGIERDEIDKVFDPFFTKKSTGTGLGLSVSHKIVEDHEGRIEVSSEVGKGTCFRIELPLNGKKKVLENAS